MCIYTSYRDLKFITLTSLKLYFNAKGATAVDTFNESMLVEFIKKVDLWGDKCINFVSWMNFMVYLKTKKNEQTEQTATIDV